MRFGKLKVSTIAILLCQTLGNIADGHHPRNGLRCHQRTALETPRSASCFPATPSSYHTQVFVTLPELLAVINQRPWCVVSRYVHTSCSSMHRYRLSLLFSFFLRNIFGKCCFEPLSSAAAIIRRPAIPSACCSPLTTHAMMYPAMRSNANQQLIVSKLWKAA